MDNINKENKDKENKDEQETRMAELILELNNANKIYEQGDEIISNAEYDKLYDELLSIEKSTGIINEDSPTRNVGYEVVSELRKVQHKSKVLSLDKTKSDNDLLSFLSDKEGMLSFKLDGLSIVLTYNDGKLIQAVTRGNGEIGEDVTHNAKVIKSIPNEINYKGNLIVRGETLISYETFERINSNLPDEEKYKNPRNLASGTLRQLDSKICAERELDFITFEVVKGFDNYYDKTNYREIFYKSEKLDLLEKEGFNIVKFYCVNKNTLQKWKSILTNQVTESPKYPYPVDGLVLTFDNISYSDSLPVTSKHPKHSLAFKWKDEPERTKLVDIEWSTSRTGLINPVAIFIPIEIEGTTVERASLHNINILKDLLGKPYVGQKLWVIKSNMIIPTIIKAEKEGEELIERVYLTIPKRCPSCGFATEVRTTGNSKTLHCNNHNCKAKLLFNLKHFCSRDAMNIDGLSEATLSKLIESSLVTNYLDIFDLTYDDLKNINGFGDKSIKNLLSSIEKSRTVQLPNFIYSLGIENIGRTAAKTISKYFNYDFDKILNSSFLELSSIDGVGTIMATSLYDYLNNDNFYQILYSSYLYVEKPSENNQSQSLKGKTFVITGEVHNFKNRNELQKHIESLGGTVSSSVSKNTDYLINNDKESSTGKTKKAKELGINILTEEELCDMI